MTRPGFPKGGMVYAEGSLEHITTLLGKAQDGSSVAMNEVMQLVYPELLRLAERQLNHFYDARATPTLEPAALVSETYLKLIRQRNRYDSQGHFLAISSQLMLRVLIDYDRSKARVKRGGNMLRVTLGEVPAISADTPIERFAAALAELEKLDPRTAETVKARVLWGLTITEIAASFDLSTRTVERDWKFAQQWLEHQLA